jgi:superfamily II DNA or RNA helicase
LLDEFKVLGIDVGMIDKTFGGNKIDLEFKGHLKDEQALALRNLIQHDTGILSGTTAFGKTVVAIKLIAYQYLHKTPFLFFEHICNFYAH